jgi:hypothetical protein
MTILSVSSLPPLGEVPAKPGKGAGPLHHFVVPLPLGGRREKP